MKNILVVANDSKLASIIENSFECRDALASLEADSEIKVTHFKSHTQVMEHLSAHFGQVNLGRINDTIVFVDLMLEEMDGLSVVETIRNQYHQLSIAAFVCKQSVSGPLEDLQLKSQAEASGANLVLLAPFNLREIGSCVDRLFAAGEETVSADSVSADLGTAAALQAETAQAATH